jgi:LDH2 family malate/lactate/ureidoglycolate dehydrogenase
MEKNKRFEPGRLTAFSAALLAKAGLDESDASTIAQDLVEADLRGLSSHGVSRIPMYLERLGRGLVTRKPNIRVEKRSVCSLLVDGDNGMGFLVAHRAVEEGCALAAQTGIALVGVKHSTHFGMSALYVNQALEQGFNSLIFTNSSPAIAAWGGRTPFLGAAPLAAGMVGGHSSPPYVLDMAMTVIARGKIRVAMINGDEIPLGLALDQEGNPTTDAKKAFEGVCLPFGGVKGSALSMLMDLVCGLYTGAGFGGEVKSLYYDHSGPQDVGHFFVFMRPDLFLSLDEYKSRMDTFYQRLKELPTAAGVDEILMPGEPERRTAEGNRERGVAVSEQILETLASTAKAYGVEISQFLS